MDLSSRGVTDEIQLGCHSNDLGEMFCMQISSSIAEKSILFDIVESVHNTVTKMASIPKFSRSLIRINTVRNY